MSNEVDFLGWQITYVDAGGFWSRDSFAHLEGKIRPSLKGMIDFLYCNKIIQTSFDNFRRYVGVYDTYEKLAILELQYQGRNREVSERFGYTPSYSDRRILEAVCEFCEHNLHFSIKHHGFGMDNYQAVRNAEYSIENDVRKYPSPKRALLNYLQSKGLVDKSVNIECDKMSKTL